ncbi:MAG: Cytochrome c-552 [Alphaproteobacteria bacterium MarineAlpha5_Bin11]|nr:cytochrome c family protein [Pelagibacteraceae bacterium]PPR44784.1 MAG: Cytochrome c-552 [Alphaproteobacteria bacterium MarineAlpha5_Bin11]PPR50233.1 MAG: Cytochrome c-552 [Alphaproteobacteria bacterium MarineAlpha5_Bin10]|tara:strand:+ start:121 stop:669 length:549 start_codon:yes stop_codon:yes gene_type:complete
MSFFEANKILAVIITVSIIFVIIVIISNLLIQPKIPEEQAYKIEIPEESISKSTMETSNIGQEVIESIVPLLTKASIEKGGKIAKQCSACHSFNNGDPNKLGPNLYEIINKPVASVNGYNYSAALNNLGGNWNYEQLNQFLYNPKNYVPGTKMSYKGLKKTEDRANLILWLREKAENPAPLP